MLTNRVFRGSRRGGWTAESAERATERGTRGMPTELAYNVRRGRPRKVATAHLNASADERLRAEEHYLPLESLCQKVIVPESYMVKGQQLFKLKAADVKDVLKYEPLI